MPDVERYRVSRGERDWWVLDTVEGYIRGPYESEEDAREGVPEEGVGGLKHEEEE